MSGTTKLILYILLAVVFGWVAVKIVTMLVSTIVGLLIPIIVIGAIVLVVAGIVNRKALGGGRRTLP